jgi:superfamily I DNA and/or RNA helicase
MDPQICGVVSQLSYGGRLTTNRQLAVRRVAERGSHGLCGAPIELHHVEGEECHPKHSMSYFNEEEARAIEKWYKVQRSGGLQPAAVEGARTAIQERNARKSRKKEKERARTRTILIICFYRAQAELLQTMLPAVTDNYDVSRHRGYKDHKLRIATVDGSQGTQADIVGMSCVRSNSSGQIGHVKVMGHLPPAFVLSGVSSYWPDLAQLCALD